MQLIIETPSREEQLAFNRRRWEEVCADSDFARIHGKIETNAHGQILMMPPASGGHSYCQRNVSRLLEQHLEGLALPECPVSTLDGVRVADVGWYSEERFALVKGQIAFETAPEICVEVLSPTNTTREMAAKTNLYFEAGAEEVWLCAEDGQISFYHKSQPTVSQAASQLCPDFPSSV